MKKYTTPEEIDSLSTKAKKRLIKWFKKNDEDPYQENIHVLQGTMELHLLSIADMIALIADSGYKDSWILSFSTDGKDDELFSDLWNETKNILEK